MITKQSKTLFLILVIIQAFHSVEEFFGKLWLYLKPAEVLSILLSDNVELGFILINLAFFIFGLWVSLFALSKNYPFAKYLVWFWIILEILNGIAHPIIAISRWEYIPGLITAPALFLLAITLAKSMRTKTIYCVDNI